MEPLGILQVSFDESCITPELEFALENHFVARISPKKDTVLDSSWLTAWMQRNTTLGFLGSYFVSYH